MSYEIIQSEKIVRVTDGTTEIYLHGSVSESNNVRPQRFDRAWLSIASASHDDARLYLVNHIRSLLGGSIHLKDMRNADTRTQAETYIRRYERVLKHAKTVYVNSITDGGDKFVIDWGEDANKRLEAAVGISVTHTINPTKRNVTNREDLEACYRYLKLPFRDIESAIAVGKIYGGFTVLADQGQNVTEEQLTRLVDATGDYYVRKLGSITDTRIESKEIALRWIESPTANSYLYDFFSREVKNDRECMLKLIERFPTYYSVSARFEGMNDIESIAINATLARYENLQYASDRLRSDENFVLAIAQQVRNVRLLEHCAPSLRNDPDFAYELYSLAPADCRGGWAAKNSLGDELTQRVGDNDAWLWLKA